MSATTHQIIALVAAFWLLTIFPVSLGLFVGTLSVVAVMIGALTPDLDQPTANIWKKMLGSNLIGNIFQAFSGGHRHMTHSLIGIIAISWVTRWTVLNLANPAYISQALYLVYGFIIGYISHPLADTFTDRGVPWFWPLRVHIKIPPGPDELRVTTNSFVERIIVRTGLIVVAVFLLQSHWSVLKNLFQ